MNILYLSGSHRKKGNTDFLIEQAKKITDGEIIRLIDYDFQYCKECWKCLETTKCIINDDFTNIITPKLLNADAIIIGTPVFFNNVSTVVKNFIDRTWCLKNQLQNKIGGIIVVGRAYGHQMAIDAISSFYLKHNMIPANRGVSAIAYKREDILKEKNAIESTKRLARRILELVRIFN